MEINPNLNSGAVNRISEQSSPARPIRATGDQAVFNRSEALNRSFAETPEVRQDKVARARELIGQVTYPPRETIAKISDLLAMNISSTRE